MPTSPEHDGGHSSPLRLGSSPLGKFAAAEEQDENFISKRLPGSYLQKTPEVSKHYASTTGADGALATPPDSARSTAGSIGNGQEATFGFANVQSTLAFSSLAGSESTKRNATSTWESRARSLGSASTLARHAAQGREQKKSHFLDRIRRRRDDARSELVGDQVLRMDFVRERRIWEDEMRRRAAEAGVDGSEEVDIDMMLDEEPAEDEMSPTEEFDPELESHCDYQAHELLGLEGSREGQGGHQHGDEFLVDEDEEYDEVFRELISKDQLQRSQGNTLQYGGGGGGAAGAISDVGHGQPEHDAGMDLS